MKTQINKNAATLFAARSVRYEKGDFNAYKRLVEGRENIRNRPSELFASGQAGKSAVVRRALEKILSHITGDERSGKAAAAEMVEFMSQYYGLNPGKTQQEFEWDCKRMLGKLIPDFEGKLKEKLTGNSGRSDIIFEQIRPYISGNSVLDIGAGDGKVGNLIHQTLSKNTTLVDVIDYNETGLPLQVYDGMILPYESNSFDTSILSVVLHHADQPLQILQEAVRVTNRRIILIESVYFNEEHKSLNSILDWFYNRVLHENVNCPFHFQTPAGWESTFRHYGLRMGASVDLGIDQPTVPEYHWLYAVDKLF